MKIKHTGDYWKHGDKHLFNPGHEQAVFSWIGENRICVADTSMEGYRQAFRILGEEIPYEISEQAEKANGILIAQAPNLLRTLEAMVKRFSSSEPWGCDEIEEAKAAIEKATTI